MAKTKPKVLEQENRTQSQGDNQTMTYYVTMTDKFMSGWGPARNKTNKLVIECETYQEALTVLINAKDRGEMRYISIRSTKPYYNPNTILTSWGNITSHQTWFRTNRPFFTPRE